MSSTEEIQQPSFIHALLTLGSITIIISVGLFYLDINLNSLMLICLVLTAVNIRFCIKTNYTTIRQGMNEGILKALPAIYIFILIGVMIASFILSGTIGTLVYFGLEFISPDIYLPMGLLLCAFMALMTGSSWATVGTLGVVLIGMAIAMNIPLPLAAGMIVSGSCFGSKMSPMCSTTNLAAISSDTNLYNHIKSMSYTAIPTFIIVFIIFSIIGTQLSTEYSEEAIVSLKEGISHNFQIKHICLLPFVVMCVLSLKKTPPEPAIISASFIAILLAYFVQNESIRTILNSIFHGCEYNTGREVLDTLFNRGGIFSMMWTLSLALLVLALGGILNKFKFLEVLISPLLKLVKNTGTLVLSTIFTCFFSNIVMGEAFLSIILGGQLFSKAYENKNINKLILSRSIEDGATMTYALIPWTTGGAFFSSVLGIPVIDYAPWAILNWMIPLVTIAFAYLGIAMFRNRNKILVPYKNS